MKAAGDPVNSLSSDSKYFSVIPKEYLLCDTMLNRRYNFIFLPFSLVNYTTVKKMCLQTSCGKFFY